jgi:predicted permease
VASTAIAEAILKMLALAGVGVLLRVTGLVKRENAKVINSLVIYAALPALVFRVARQTDLSPDLLKVAAVAWIVGGAGFLVAWGLARLLRLPRRTAGAFILVTALGNTGYIGYPVATMLLGDKALPQAVFYDVFGTVALLFTVGVIVAGRMGSHQGKVSPLPRWWPCSSGWRAGRFL